MTASPATENPVTQNPAAQNPAGKPTPNAPDRDLELETQIDIYLQAHPEFLRDHWQLREDETSPSTSSLSGRQIALLRQRNADLHEKLQAMFSHASNNETISRSLFSLLSQLLRCHSIEEKLLTLSQGLNEYFAIAHLRLCLRPPLSIADCAVFDETSEKLFNDVIRSGRPSCARLRVEQQQYLFGEQSIDVRSTALIPLGDQARWGMAAMGSEFRDQFTPEQDTLFLSILGDCCSAVIEGEIRE